MNFPPRFHIDALYTRRRQIQSKKLKRFGKQDSALAPQPVKKNSIFSVNPEKNP
jgi:hypothetical protein